MKIAIIFIMLIQLTTAAITNDRYAKRTHSVLVNAPRFSHIVARIKSIREQRIIKQAFLQCISGFRSDSVCDKLAYLMTVMK